MNISKQVEKAESLEFIGGFSNNALIPSIQVARQSDNSILFANEDGELLGKLEGIEELDEFLIEGIIQALYGLMGFEAAERTIDEEEEERE